MAASQYFKREAIFLNGSWRQANSNKSIDVFNPANGQKIGYVPNAGEEETREVVKAAKLAFEDFRKTTALERANILRKLHDEIMQNQEALAELLTLEQGKPLAEARAEISIAASYLLWFAEEARRVFGDLIPSPHSGQKLMVSKQPIGVVAAITPWNFPFSMIARKVGPAIAAGCSVIVKPSELTPFSGLAWGVIAEDIGLPNGVINIITGEAEAIGHVLTRHLDVRKLTFTGSTRVGKQLLEKSASTVKKISMELGGNAPFIVFEDADLDKAVEGAIAAKYRNSGQTCICTNRFYVHASIYDDFVENFTKETKKLKVGNGFDLDITQGPLINEAAIDKAKRFVEDAKQKGGVILTGGKPYLHSLETGYFFEPTVIANATKDMLFSKEEIFAPIAPIYKFESEAEVIALANDTDYGLAAYFYTQDLARSFRVSDALDYGMIGVNAAMLTKVEAPFGGVKASGLGKEGGSQGIDEYLESKYICLGGLEA